MQVDRPDKPNFRLVVDKVIQRHNHYTNSIGFLNLEAIEQIICYAEIDTIITQLKATPLVAQHTTNGINNYQPKFATLRRTGSKRLMSIDRTASDCALTNSSVKLSI